jgi:DNA-binding transcriptional MerR regulator
MSKTNYTKVEENLEKGILKMNVANLLQEADAADARKKDKNAPSPFLEEGQTSSQLDLAKKKLLISLKQDLNRLYKQDSEVYRNLGYKKKDIKKLIEKPSELTPEDWTAIKEIKERVEEYKKDLEAIFPKLPDDALVEGERKAHINKRFNVQKSWLPLH